MSFQVFTYQLIKYVAMLWFVIYFLIFIFQRTICFLCRSLAVVYILPNRIGNVKQVFAIYQKTFTRVYKDEQLTD